MIAHEFGDHRGIDGQTKRKVGPREQLTDNIRATQVGLDANDIAALDEVSRLPPEYPGWMLERQGAYRD